MLLAFYYRLPKEHPRYTNIITATNLEMSSDEFCQALRDLCEEKLISVNEQQLADMLNPKHCQHEHDSTAFITNQGRQTIEELLTKKPATT